MNTARLTVYATLVASLAIASSSSAQEVSRERREATQRMKEGMAAYARGDFEEARVSLMEAYAVMPEAANLAWDLGLAEAKSHHAVDALRHLRIYLKSGTPSDSDRAIAKKYMDQAARETGHIAVVADPGVVVTLDGTEVRDSLVDPVDTEPGAHVLVARRGSKSKTLTLAPQAGETLTADLRLPEDPPPSVPSQAPSTPPPAMGPVPPSPPAAPRADGQKEAGGPSNGVRIGVTAVFGALGVTGVVLGGVFAGKASADGSLGRSLVAPCANGDTGACARGHNAAEDQATERNLSTGYFIGGAALAGAAVASWFLLAPRTSPGAALAVVPQVSPSGAGCVMSGGF